MNIGIIGSGNIVENFIDAAAKIDGINIVALYTRDNRPKFNIPLAYGDLDEMLANRDINFIYVASPNSLHYAHSLKALLAGKNVICEKPFTSTAKEARHLTDTARKNGLMIFEAITTIHLPNFQAIRDNLYRIGAIRVIQLNFSQYSRRYDALSRGELPNVFNPAFSGGCLQDLNVYNVHFVSRMFGVPAFYQYFPNLHENGIDASGVLVMQYPGCVATLTAAKDSTSDCFAYIQGENGFISVTGPTNTCAQVFVNINGETPQAINMQHEQNQLFYELESFKAIFDDGDFDKCYELAEYSASVMELLETTRKQAEIVFPADLGDS